MNKKMRELLSQIEAKQTAAKAFMNGESPDADKAKSELDAADELQKQYDVEKRLFEAEKDNVPTVAIISEKAVNGFAIISKLMRNQRLNDEEKALISGTNAASGENFLIPADVDALIRELRKSYVSAKTLLTVIPTESTTGTFNFESGTPTGLVAFDDGDSLDVTGDPTFIQKVFTIVNYGKLIPVSNILKGTEKGGLMAYLNNWFVKNAIISENAEIFTILKAGKAPTILKNWVELKSSINKSIDPSALIDGVLVTNQSGYDVLDCSLDAVGRPILTASAADPMRKMFNGLPIQVFPDAQLANVGGDAPLFYGSLKAGGYFIDKDGYEFAVSDQYLFNKNQTALRVIESFDVIQADSAAYAYNLLDIPA